MRVCERGRDLQRLQASARRTVPRRIATSLASMAVVALAGTAAPAWSDETAGAQFGASLSRAAAHGTFASRPTSSWTERTVKVPGYGSVKVYIPARPTARVVLLISGENGWTKAMAGLARRIAPGAIVMGVTYATVVGVGRWAPGCWYPAADLETISRVVQRRIGRPEYTQPVLAGYSVGGSLVYATLAMTTPIAFPGGVSIAFCPEFPMQNALCAAGSFNPVYDEHRHVNALPRVSTLSPPWRVLQGTEDHTCDVPRVKAFVGGMGRTSLIEVAGAGHSLSDADRWGIALERALDATWTDIDAPVPKPPVSVARAAGAAEIVARLGALGLPLTITWPAGATAAILFVSGDGGWASLDQGVAQRLERRRIAVLGLSSLRYFWKQRTAAEIANDAARVLGATQQTGIPVFAGGYSFGASVVPAMVRGLPDALRHEMAGLVLISPSASASFQVDPLDWIREPPENRATLIVPVLERLGVPTLCVAGSDESSTPCVHLASAPFARIIRLPGAHHYNSDYDALGDAVGRFLTDRLSAMHR